MAAAAIARADLPAHAAAALPVAEAALANAYSPFSGIQVAAALLLEGGAVIIGTNYESASYGLTLCAERAAIASAQSAASGPPACIGIVLAARDRASGKGLQLTPCGACRQWIVELANRCGQAFPLYCFAAGAANGTMLSSAELLPDAFSLDPA
jgi:cytidine deaminase